MKAASCSLCVKTPSSSVPLVKHGINKRTADKWLAEYDKELNTLVWLKHKLADHDFAVVLKCTVRMYAV